MRKGIAKQLFKLSVIALALNTSLYANPNDYIRATAPYRIKPNVPSAAPSGLAPATVRSIYGFDQIPNQGEGKTIVIVDAYDDPNIEQDLAMFSTTFNLPACTTANGCFKKIYASGTQPAGDTGWGIEIALDVEWAHAIAPKANIILVETADNYLVNLFGGVKVALQNNPDVVSMSWGAQESSSSDNGSSYESIFNVTGVEFTAASMDSGHGAWYPAAFAQVIGVGGTTLKSNAGNYSETAWSGSGGGISQYVEEPTYQINYSIPNNPNKMRGIPDVAYIGDPNTGFSIYDSYGYSGWMVIGGTSAGAPQWAALIAIAKSATSAKLINILPSLYTIAQNNYSGTYNDVTSGSNGSCGTLCNAAVGYDYVTGLGSPKAAALIPAIIGKPSVTVTPSAVSLTTGQTQQFTATVVNSTDNSVAWSASGGSITSTGLYTAPMTTGNYVVTATSVTSSVQGTANVTVTSGPPSGSNLALNQPTVASSEYTSATAAASLATDNDPINTQWSAYDTSNGNWLMVDLGTSSNLTGTQVKWGSNNLWKYKIETSPDENQWTMVVDKTNNSTSAQTYTDSFQATGRYVRITSTGKPTNQRTAIYDFEAMGTHAAPPPTNNPVNLALNKPTTASSQYSNAYGPAMGTDTDTMLTRWCAVNGTNGQWLKVDLGASSNIVKTRVKWESYGVWQYKVEVSPDNTNWTLAVDKTANTVPSQTYEDLFTGKARYVRVTATTNQTGHWASIFDFEVFGNQ